MYPTNDGRDSPAGFFSHHGFWALGVRLFRHLGFRAKAGIVSLCFMLPMAVLGAAWLGGHLDQRDFTGKEIRGLVFAREAMALLPLAVKQRETALQPAGAVANGGDPAWQSAMKRVEEAQAASGDDFGTAAALSLVKERHGALALAKGGRATHDAMVRSVIDLVTQITDGSNLTLDPDIDTYYLMDGSLMRVPPYIDEVAKLRLLASAPKEASNDGAATAQHRAQAYADLLDEQLQGAIAKVDGLHPGARQVLMGQAAKAQDTDSLLAIQTRMFAQLDELLAVRQARNDQRASVIVVVVALGLLCAGYFFASFYRVMEGGLKETRRHLLAMTDGDLTTHPRPWGKDEAAQLMGALGQMQTSLRTIVRDVRHGSDQILQASGEIAHGAIDLSSRTEEAAANLQQTAATMEQIAGTAQHTADSAATAASIARENAGAANQGGQAMGNVVRTMEAIGQSSSRIGEIIGVIDGIAFQTNILALNAAVEAARAGDAGRGFAVVAAEVRGLAQRSGDAAREIKSLIQTSMGQVADGNHVVTGARQAIDAVVANADRVGGLIDEIATGAQQQSANLHEVGKSAHELDRSTQGNAALVEQTAAAAASLRERAADLASRVAAFRLPDSTEIG